MSASPPMQLKNGCVFEHRLAPGEPPFRQVVPLYDDVHVAIAAFEGAASVELERARTSPLWATWEIFWHRAFGAATAGNYVAPLTPFVFRGQRMSGFDVVPTVFRELPRDREEAQQELRRRNAEQEVFLRAVLDDPRVSASIPNHLSLSFEQKLAVARHYGCASAFLDLTMDFRTAAYFATKGVRPNRDRGVVYLVSLVDLMALPGTAVTFTDADTGTLAYDKTVVGSLRLHWQSPGPTGIEWVSTTIHINRPLQFALRFISVPGARRIEAQKAVFLRVGRTAMPGIDEVDDARSGWKILRLVAQKFSFFHSAGSYFDAALRIDQGHLMTADDPVDTLFAEQRRSARPDHAGG